MTETMTEPDPDEDDAEEINPEFRDLEPDEQTNIPNDEEDHEEVIE